MIVVPVRFVLLLLCSTLHCLLSRVTSTGRIPYWFLNPPTSFDLPDLIFDGRFPYCLGLGMQVVVFTGHYTSTDILLFCEWVQALCGECPKRGGKPVDRCFRGLETDQINHGPSCGTNLQLPCLLLFFINFRFRSLFLWEGREWRPHEKGLSVRWSPIVLKLSF